MKETLKKLKPTKEMWIQIKWILSHAKPVIPYLIFSIIICSLFSLLDIYSVVVVSKSLIDSAISGNAPEVIKWLIIMVGIALISLLSTPLISFITTHSSTKLNQSIQKEIYNHIEYSDWLALNNHHSMSILTRITSDVKTVSSTLLSTIPNLVSLFITLIGSFYTLIIWAPSIALIATLIGPFLIIISRVFGSKLKKLYKEVQEVTVKYNSFMQESIQNIMITKTFCMEKNNMSQLEDIQDNRYKLSMKNTKFSVLTSLSLDACSSAVYFTIFCWGALNIAKGVTSYGQFTSMLQLYNKVQSPISSLAYMVPGLISTLAATERLMELESIPLEKNIDEAYTPSIIQPNIKFTDVSFKYNDDANILNSINLNINFGDTIAFIGPSGEGKTTIIRLILSLINPSDGDITIYNESSTSTLNRYHRNLISYVPQGNTLFSGTIEDNLRYGKLNATESEIMDALKNACALDFINDLENGLQTKIGERGVGISEGQAQRIAIARTFLRERPILILDEATSSLDPETELKVLQSVKNLKHKPTCIIITHRPSALDICSRVVKLKGGSLEEINHSSILEVATGLI